MGVMDKLKKILFDEEDVEIPVSSDELPERELRIVADKAEKKVPSRSSKREVEPARSFKDYHIEDDDEDTIVELKLPKEEEEDERPPVQEKRIKFPIDDFDDDDEEEYIPTRSAKEEIKTTPSRNEPTRSESSRSENSRNESSRIPKYISDIANEQKKEPREEKDYRKIIHDLDDENKKPFEVTPIISPVFGVLNKNYKQEELAEKKALITQANSGAKPRLYGPVSYNDAPLPKPPVFEAKKTGLKEELVELNSTISDLINDNNEVDESEIEMPAKATFDEDYTETIDIPKIIDNDDDEDDLIIETENYDEITSSIETTANTHTSIEDAFEPTSEFDSISDYDREVEKRSIEEEISEEEYEEDEPIEYEENFVASHKIEEDEEIEDDLEEVEIQEDKVVSKKSKPRKSKIVEEAVEEEIEDENEKIYEEYEKTSDDDHLTDTIETDLFNLIDSMYKDDEDEEDSEDE
ncbi:MAG: hypothetical protein K2G03_03880 [Bacilli bacterium]|nr:hypothetical protein [Bacilli bacterium]